MERARFYLGFGHLLLLRGRRRGRRRLCRLIDFLLIEHPVDKLDLAEVGADREAHELADPDPAIGARELHQLRVQVRNCKLQREDYSQGINERTRKA